MGVAKGAGEHVIDQALLERKGCGGQSGLRCKSGRADGRSYKRFSEPATEAGCTGRRESGFQKLAARWMIHSNTSMEAWRPKSAQKKTESWAATSVELVQVNLGIPHLGGLHQFIPGDFAPLVSGGARHHAGKGRFGALGGLTMEMAGGDALDEGLLFFRIGELEVGGEVSGDREFFRLGRILRGRSGGLPGLIAPDAQRAFVGRLGGSFGAEEAFGDVPPTLGKLRGAEGNVDAIGIVKDGVVISVDVAVGRAPLAPASRGSLQGMSLENPVANVDDVNVLLHNDVAGKNAVIQPVAEATLCVRGVRPGGPVNVAGEIVSFAADDFAKSSSMDTTNHFHKRRAIADLESDIETELDFGALADFDHLQRTGHIDGHALFETNMFTAGHDNRNVAGAEESARGRDARRAP